MDSVIQTLGSIFLAIIPASIWGFIFLQKKTEHRKLVVFTFIIGGLSVFPILIYKFLWQFFPWMNAFAFADRFSNDMVGFSNIIVIPLSVIITFMIVGIIEELMKMFSVKIADDSDDIQDIDDAIELFIIAALGFSFVENVLYFYSIWMTNGAEHLFVPFLFRSAFSTFAHLVFSGVFGYYYGIAHFADPILQEEIKKDRKHWTVLLHKIFNFRKEKLFHEEKLLEGLIISVALHALFNIFLEMGFTFMIVPFLTIGYIVLNYLLHKKENHKAYGKLLAKKRNCLMFDTKRLNKKPSNSSLSLDSSQQVFCKIEK